MKIILIRHGQATAYQENDSTRLLTDFGREQADATADYVATHYQPNHFVVSPYTRAQQTLESFTKRMSDVPVTVQNNLTPEDDAKTALQTLYDTFAQDDEQTIVVVCHMPIVANLVALITDDSPVSYALAEARVIDTPVLTEGLGKQTDVFIPKQP